MRDDRKNKLSILSFVYSKYYTVYLAGINSVRGLEIKFPENIRIKPCSHYKTSPGSA